MILPLTFEQKLDLHDNRFDNLSVEAIAAALQDGGGMPCLDELYLGFNTFADECLPYVAFFGVYMYTWRAWGSGAWLKSKLTAHTHYPHVQQ